LLFPLPGRRIPQPSVLRTHPDTEERVTRLLELVGGPHLEPIVVSETPMFTLVGYGPGQLRPRYRWPGVWY
jgi:heat shock protein HtpX